MKPLIAFVISLSIAYPVAGLAGDRETDTTREPAGVEEGVKGSKSNSDNRTSVHSGKSNSDDRAGKGQVEPDNRKVKGSKSNTSE